MIKVRIYYLLSLNLAFFHNYVIFLKFCDWMRFEVNCGKSHHRVISDVLILGEKRTLSFVYFYLVCPTNFRIVTLPDTNTVILQESYVLWYNGLLH